jgi:DNA modification methylase
MVEPSSRHLLYEVRSREMKSVILLGDVRQRLSEIPEGSVRTCVTSPPYFGLRDYGVEGQIGLEQTPDAYVAEMVSVFREVWRVLADDGTLWLNIGDSYVGGKGQSGQGSPDFQAERAKNGESINQAYHQIAGKQQTRPTDDRAKMREAGLKPKDLIGIPWRVAFALQADGWYLRQDIIWAKPNPMPESVTDRCTKSHEYVFLLSKSARYYYDHESVKEPAIHSADRRSGEGRLTYDGKRQGDKGTGQEAFVSIVDKRNKRDVWTINTKPYKGAHFAVMPEALVEPCVLAGSAEGDTVLDPFTGSGTVAVVANRHGRNFVGTELNPEYSEIAKARIKDDSPMFNEVEVT